MQEWWKERSQVRKKQERDSNSQNVKNCGKLKAICNKLFEKLIKLFNSLEAYSLVPKA
jgi:hypothetical protein